MSSITTSTPSEFWEHHYQEGTTHWDIGQAAPPFQSLLQSIEAPVPGCTAVLGSGRGYDALLFANHGFDTIGFDFAHSAIAEAEILAQASGSTAKFLQRDIFDLAAEFPGSFDYVVEHTCFCAIAPEQRQDYVKLVRTLLQPQGQLIALFWCHSRPGGPPFGADIAEIHTLFDSDFDTSNLFPADNSVPTRQNEEWIGRFRKRINNDLRPV